jgi:hypothetical protein
MNEFDLTHYFPHQRESLLKNYQTLGFTRNLRDKCVDRVAGHLRHLRWPITRLTNGLFNRYVLEIADPARFKQQALDVSSADLTFEHLKGFLSVRAQNAIAERENWGAQKGPGDGTSPAGTRIFSMRKDTALAIRNLPRVGPLTLQECIIVAELHAHVRRVAGLEPASSDPRLLASFNEAAEAEQALLRKGFNAAQIRDIREDPEVRKAVLTLAGGPAAK